MHSPDSNADETGFILRALRRVWLRSVAIAIVVGVCGLPTLHFLAPRSAQGPQARRNRCGSSFARKGGLTRVIRTPSE